MPLVHLVLKICFFFGKPAFYLNSPKPTDVFRDNPTAEHRPEWTHKANLACVLGNTESVVRC